MIAKFVDGPVVVVRYAWAFIYAIRPKQFCRVLWAKVIAFFFILSMSLKYIRIFDHLFATRNDFFSVPY